MRPGPDVRFQVFHRAGGRCEYCRIHEEDASFSHELDHVISIQHGGSDDIQNLALACLFCNRYKGTNIASIGSAGALVRLFDPRNDRWADHFSLAGAVIEPLTPEGMATAKLLRFNSAERVIERGFLQRLGSYPRV